MSNDEIKLEVTATDELIGDNPLEDSPKKPIGAAAQSGDSAKLDIDEDEKSTYEASYSARDAIQEPEKLDDAESVPIEQVDKSEKLSEVESMPREQIFKSENEDHYLLNESETSNQPEQDVETARSDINDDEKTMFEGIHSNDAVPTDETGEGLSKEIKQEFDQNEPSKSDEKLEDQLAGSKDAIQAENLVNVEEPNPEIVDLKNDSMDAVNAESLSNVEEPIPEVFDSKEDSMDAVQTESLANVEDEEEEPIPEVANSNDDSQEIQHDENLAPIEEENLIPKAADPNDSQETQYDEKLISELTHSTDESEIMDADQKDDLPKNFNVRDYLKNITPLLKAALVRLVKERPEDQLDFLIKYLAEAKASQAVI